MVHWSNKIEQVHIWTIIHNANSKLWEWTQTLDKDYYLELGDNPELVQHIEQDLNDLTIDIYKLETYLGIANLPLSLANNYYVVTKYLEDATQLVGTIRESDFGSRENTRQCLKLLQQCSKGVKELSQFIPQTTQLS